MRILVIEDHALVREGLLLALKDSFGVTEVIGAKSADEAATMLAANADYDLALLDLMLPGTGGLVFLGVLRKCYPQIPVVILSAQDDAETVRKCIKQGAAGYISKASSTDVLLDALQQVMSGELWVPPEHRTAPSAARRPKSVAERFELTKTQSCVLDLLAEGKSNRDIATLLDVTEGTVKIHVSAIFKALGVKSRSQALLVAQGKRQ